MLVPYNVYLDRQIDVNKFLKMFKNEANKKARLEDCFEYCELRKKDRDYEAKFL